MGPLTLWHHDPCRGAGGDDSCGWFKRAHHGDPKILAEIQSDFRFNWSCTLGWFTANGDPVMSTPGTVLNMFSTAAWIYFRRDRAKMNRFLRKHLLDILLFAENPVDGLASSITGRYGEDREPAADRANQMASCVYGWILRKEQKWWQHPHWHFHHWRLTCRPFWRVNGKTVDACAKGAIIVATAFLLTGCAADGSFDGAAFRQVVGAADDTYRTYEEQKRLNASPYAPAP